MPRKYKSKLNKDRTYGYSILQSLKDAAASVKRGKSVRKAAESYGVGRSTLHDFIKNGGSLKNNHGGQTLFTKIEEKERLRRVGRKRS